MSIVPSQITARFTMQADFTSRANVSFRSYWDGLELLGLLRWCRGGSANIAVDYICVARQKLTLGSNTFRSPPSVTDQRVDFQHLHVFLFFFPGRMALKQLAHQGDTTVLTCLPSSPRAKANATAVVSG